MDNLSPASEQRLEALKQELGPSIAIVPAIPSVITSPEDERMVAESIANIRSKITQIEYKRDEYIKPIKQTIDKIRADFGALISPFEAALKQANDTFTAYRESPAYKAEQERLEQLKDAARVAAQAGDVDTVQALADAGSNIMAAQPKAVGTESGATVSVRKSWGYDIIDEALVPREFCKPDPGKLRAAVNAGARNIPGVSITQKISTSVREQK